MFRRLVARRHVASGSKPQPRRTASSSEERRFLDRRSILRIGGMAAAGAAVAVANAAPASAGTDGDVRLGLPNNAGALRTSIASNGQYGTLGLEDDYNQGNGASGLGVYSFQGTAISAEMGRGPCAAVLATESDARAGTPRHWNCTGPKLEVTDSLFNYPMPGGTFSLQGTDRDPRPSRQCEQRGGRGRGVERRQRCGWQGHADGDAITAQSTAGNNGVYALNGTSTQIPVRRWCTATAPMPPACSAR